MVNIKQAYIFARYNLNKCISNPRVIISFVLLTVLCVTITDRYIEYANSMNLTIQVFEPFIIMFTRSYSLVYFSLVALLLFGDIPFLENGLPYYLIRSNRRNWVLGQLIYMLFISVLMVIYSLIICSMVGSRISFLGNIWSDTAQFVAYGAAKEMLDTISPNILVMGLPWEITGYIVGLMSLYIMFLSSTVFAMNMLRNKSFALTIAIILIFSGYIGAVGWLGPKSSWFSVLVHANYATHSFRDIKYLPRLIDSYLVFSALILVECYIAYVKGKHYNYNFTGDQP